jgi:hypothetical protein
MAAGKFALLPIDEVQLDRTNPRIRRFLEIHQGEPTYAQIALALDVAGGTDGEGATTPEKLRNSILTNGGIMQPIIVNKQTDGSLVCIEGNTRLYIYRSFVEDGTEGDWSKIPALIHEGLGNSDVDAIRLQAHLVGPRQWDAYSKAKYLWELQHKELMPLDRIVAFCGGNKREVTQAIQAYADMEHYYKPICDANDYDTEKYSGFVELQNSKVKDSIMKAGYDLTDFASWLDKGNIKGLTALVRAIDDIYGPKKDLMLMDNNVVASPRFKDIIAEIRDLGFTPGAKIRRSQEKVAVQSCMVSNSRFERDFVKLSQNQNLCPLFVPREQTVAS